MHPFFEVKTFSNLLKEEYNNDIEQYLKHNQNNQAAQGPDSAANGTAQAKRRAAQKTKAEAPPKA